PERPRTRRTLACGRHRALAGWVQGLRVAYLESGLLWPAASIALLACRRTAAKADDVTVGVLHIEVLRAPRRRRERLQNRCTVGDAITEKGFDAVHAGRSVEVLVGAPGATLLVVLRRFFQV